MENIDAIKEKVKPYEPSSYRGLYENDENQLFIFLSIDICNSTQLKSKKNIKWFNVNKILYDYDFSKMTFWKLNGDEVLYYEQFSNIGNLLDIIHGAYNHLKDMEHEINNKIICSENIKLQGTIWLARTDTSSAEDLNNIRLKNDVMTEYIGLSIDEGFRLTKKASKSKIIIDPKIIYLLNLAHDAANNIIESPLKEMASKIKNIMYIDFFKNTYFIGYTKLKGIWSNRSYPVFWYFCDNDNDLDYDEQLDQVHIRDRMRCCYDDEGIKTPNLAGIFNEVNVSEEFSKIMSLAVQSNGKRSIESFARLYYTCLCVNPNTNHVLIVQRSIARHHLKNVWEFGVCKHTSVRLSAASAIEIAYKNEFGIDIEIVTDEEKENNILPFHFCTIYRNGVKHNSILCLAKIKVDSSTSDEDLLQTINNVRDPQKYQLAKFIDANEAKNYKSITLDQIAEDSVKAIDNNATTFENDCAIMYFEKSVIVATNYFAEENKGRNWYER